MVAIVYNCNVELFSGSFKVIESLELGGGGGGGGVGGGGDDDLSKIR